MTNSQQSEVLPITKLIDEEIGMSDNFRQYILPQVRKLETETETEAIARAKESEKNRIVGILGTMKNESYSGIDFTWKMSVEDTLQEAITRITN